MMLVRFFALAAFFAAAQADHAGQQQQLILPGAVLSPELEMEVEQQVPSQGGWMPLSLPLGLPSLFSLLGGSSGLTEGEEQERSGPGAMMMHLLPQQLSASPSFSFSSASSASTSALQNPAASSNKEKKGPCGRHGPLGRRGGPFFAPEFFESIKSNGEGEEGAGEQLVTMVVVGGGSPEQVDASSFPLALPHENGEETSSSAAALSGPNGPFDVFSSLFRAFESAAAAAGSDGGGGGGGIRRSSLRLSPPDSEGRDAPLAEKKGSGSDEDEEHFDDDDDDDDDDEILEQQQQQQPSDASQQEETLWLSSSPLAAATENAASFDDGDDDDELSSSSLSPSLSPFSLTSFVDDRYLGMLGFALLCAASGAAWVATVSAVSEIKRETREKVAREFRVDGKGRRRGKAEVEEEPSASLLEPLAGAGGFGSATIKNPLYYGVVSAADFVEK